LVIFLRERIGELLPCLTLREKFYGLTTTQCVTENTEIHNIDNFLLDRKEVVPEQAVGTFKGLTHICFTENENELLQQESAWRMQLALIRV
jgi:hypothetical protein